MLNLLLVSLLVASAAGVPRSRGEPLHRSLQAQSGRTIQYNQNAAAHMVPVVRNINEQVPAAPQSQATGATFQVDPNTLQIQQVVQHGQQKYQVVSQPSFQNPPAYGQPSFQNPPAYGQPTFHQASPLQPTLHQTLSGQQIFQYPPAPQALPVQPTVHQGLPGQQIFQHPPAPQALPVQPTVHQGLPGQQIFQHPSATHALPVQPTVHQALPGQQIFQHPPAPKPLSVQPTFHQVSPLQPTVHQALPSHPPPPSPPSNEIVKRLIGNPPGGALLVGTHPPIFPIEKRLISNYTKLRPIVKDTFRCAKSNQPNYVGYGYYADVDNDCQIFHVCLPWKELYPKTFDSEVTYQFSFICPNQTVFSQDVLTCTWRSEAFPCADSPHLYWMNDNFFRKVNRDDGFGMRIRYAHVNEKLEHPLKYDYDDFNP